MLHELSIHCATLKVPEIFILLPGYKKDKQEPGLVVYNCNPSSQEAEAGERIRSSGSELKAILGPCLKIKQNTGGPRRSGTKVRSLASNAPKTDRRFVAHEGTRCPI